MLSRRPPAPVEQLTLIRVAATPKPDVTRPVKPARPDCSVCPKRVQPKRQGPAPGKARNGLDYATARGRVLEAVLALADCPDDDAAAWHAAWQRLRNASESWLKREAMPSPVRLVGAMRCAERASL